MNDIFQQIRDQIHEIRNAIAPVDFKLENFGLEIEECRSFFEEKAVALEAKVIAQSLKLEDQGTRISNILDRLQWIELTLKVPPQPEPGNHPPVNGEKTTQLRSQSPAHEKGQGRF